jgi:hypothetical protein
LDLARAELQQQPHEHCVRTEARVVDGASALGRGVEDGTHIVEAAEVGQCLAELGQHLKTAGIELRPAMPAASRIASTIGQKVIPSP